MASKAVATTALLLTLNILFFTMVSSCGTGSSPPPVVHTPPPSPKALAVPTAGGSCPRDTLKIGACVNVLNGELVNLVLGQPPSSPACCPLIQGLADLQAAVCLCTTLKLNVLNIINLNVPIDVSLIVNSCGRNAPEYKCA